MSAGEEEMLGRWAAGPCPSVGASECDHVLWSWLICTLWDVWCSWSLNISRQCFLIIVITINDPSPLQTLQDSAPHEKWWT